MFRPETLSECSARRCRDDDTGRCDEEEGRALRESCGGRGVGATRQEPGLSLTGPDGLLKQFTKTVLETVLNEEMTEHLGHDKNQASPERESSNFRNGTRSKTVLTEATGHIPIDVPRDREGMFEPQIVKKRQRRLNGVDEIVLSLYAKGLTTGEISAHFAEICGASVSKDRTSILLLIVQPRRLLQHGRALTGRQVLTAQHRFGAPGPRAGLDTASQWDRHSFPESRRMVRRFNVDKKVST